MHAVALSHSPQAVRLQKRFVDGLGVPLFADYVARSRVCEAGMPLGSKGKVKREVVGSDGKRRVLCASGIDS